LRCLSRRRFKTRRPAFVCIRLRKPWVRARLRFFGWYVRFMRLGSVALRQFPEFPRSLQACSPRADNGRAEQLYARASS
jgi:hypothetical protein